MVTFWTCLAASLATLGMILNIKEYFRARWLNNALTEILDTQQENQDNYYRLLSIERAVIYERHAKRSGNLVDYQIATTRLDSLVAEAMALRVKRLVETSTTEEK